MEGSSQRGAGNNQRQGHPHRVEARRQPRYEDLPNARFPGYTGQPKWR